MFSIVFYNMHTCTTCCFRSSTVSSRWLQLGATPVKYKYNSIGLNCSMIGGTGGPMSGVGMDETGFKCVRSAGCSVDIFN